MSNGVEIPVSGNFVVKYFLVVVYKLLLCEIKFINQVTVQISNTGLKAYLTDGKKFRFDDKAVTSFTVDELNLSFKKTGLGESLSREWATFLAAQHNMFYDPIRSIFTDVLMQVKPFSIDNI